MTDAPDSPERPAYLIRKHGAYYRPNARGYTDSVINAGRYTLADAVAHSHPNGPNGPRDGMTYIHEDEVQDEAWDAHKAALEAARAATLPAPVEALDDKLTKALKLMEDACWSLEVVSYPAAGGDDAEVGWEVVEYHMTAPKRRVIETGNTPIRAILNAYEGERKDG